MTPGIRRALCLLCILGVTACEKDSPPPPPATVTVYALAGQSNASGHGAYLDLSVPDRAQDLRYIQWEALAEPWDIFPTQWSLGGPLKRNGVYSYFGPELFTAKGLADDDRNIAIIKYAHGGQALAASWLPSQHTDYDVLIAVITDALAALDASGTPWVWGGVIWVGSEGDAGNATWQADWTPNFETFIAALRSDLGEPNLKIFFPRLCDAMSMTYLAEVRAQETAYPSTHPNTYMIDTDGLTLVHETPPTKDIHYDSAGQGSTGAGLGQRIAAAIIAAG